VTAQLFESWRWASSESHVDGKDGAVEPSGVVESPERTITLNHPVGGVVANPRFLLETAQSSLEAV